MAAVDPSRAAFSPARYGLTDPNTEQMLAQLEWSTDAKTEPIFMALAASADPNLVLRFLVRLQETQPQQWEQTTEQLRINSIFRAQLFAVVGASSALADFLIAQPHHLAVLVNSLHSESSDITEVTDILLAAVEAIPTDTGPRAQLTGKAAIRALREAYRARVLRIAAADVAPTVLPDLPAISYETIVERLSDLAAAALTAALAVAYAEVLPAGNSANCTFSIIAMGKCGARELNYVSDVDVIFVAEGDLSVAHQLAAAVMRIAGESCFQVDAGLRPEGRLGALVRTLEGHVSYYRRWAKTWEFQALLKARPIAGDARLGQSYVDSLMPMVWSAAEREAFVSDAQAMRRRVEENVPQELVSREIKLGRGGLRDVEFAVQLLQMVHGRADSTLHVQSTVDALAVLGAGGYIGRVDAAELANSYRFLRTVEHRLQLQKLRRTHLFPAENDSTALRWLARAMNIQPDSRHDVADKILAEFRRHSNRIRRLHEKLFYRPLLTAVAQVPGDALRLSTTAARDRLAALGYASPEGALRHIAALTDGISRRAAIQNTLLPVLLDLFARSPDPDGGLLAYRKVSDALATTPWYLRLLRDEGQVVERLALLLGTTKAIPDLLIRAPEGLQLLADDHALARRTPTEVAQSLHSAVARYTDPVAAVTAARALRRHELLRVACADVLGLLTLPEVCTALSSMWVAVLKAAVEVATQTVLAEFGGKKAEFAVIGMGRLGGAELGYGSDADVLFVCAPLSGVTDVEAVRYATAIAEKVRQLLSIPTQDPPLTLDADLRPEGRSGPLVRTLASYRAYYAQWSEIWEAQALLRAYPVAGNAELAQSFIQAVDEIRYPASGLSHSDVVAIRKLKARVEAERLPRGADPNTHTKLGRGGLADVEWTVQLLQLQHAHRLPTLRTPSTMDALVAAHEAHLLSDEDAAALRAAWELASKARNAVTLVRGKPTDQLPAHGRELAATARVLGYPASVDLGEVLHEYRGVARRARSAVERLFYGAEQAG